MKYIYLHGFASGVNSNKAVFFKQKFSNLNYDLLLIDLNLDDFYNVTVSKMIARVAKEFDNEDVCLIGSSLGGLISLILAEQYHNISKLVLLAPALEINSLWSNILGIDNLTKWQNDGQLLIPHYGLKQDILLNHNFLIDLAKLQDTKFTRELAVEIFHGINDLTIPVEVSERYIKHNSHAKLHKLDSDHSLESSLDFIWNKVETFLFSGEL